jgi:hypothetical protein
MARGKLSQTHYFVIIQLHLWICGAVTAKEVTGSNPVAPSNQWSIA